MHRSAFLLAFPSEQYSWDTQCFFRLFFLLSTLFSTATTFVSSVFLFVLYTDTTSQSPSITWNNCKRVRTILLPWQQRPRLRLLLTAASAKSTAASVYLVRSTSSRILEKYTVWYLVDSSLPSRIHTYLFFGITRTGIYIF